MLELKRVEIEDQSWCAPLLASEPTMACEYSFPTLYLWGGSMNKRIARMDGRLVVRLYEGEQTAWFYPVGTGPLGPVLEAMKQNAAEQGAPLRLVCVPGEFCEKLEKEFPGRFEFTPYRDAFDYLYDVERLSELRGKKMHAKRNHINRFNDEHPDWMFEPLSERNLAQCAAMDEEWFALRQPEVDEEAREQLGYENHAVSLALEHFRELGLEGGLIRAEGKVLAFALGSALTEDCYGIRFEKAFGHIQGAYSAISREFARHIRRLHPEVTRINREDDMGVEGLRKAKLSYHPDLLLEKFVVTEKLI